MKVDRPVREGSAGAAAPSVPEYTSSYRWVALFLAFLCQWGFSVIGQVLPPVAPLFQGDLGLSKAQVGMFVASVAAGTSSMVLVGGLLTDRFGIRRMMSIGLIGAGGFLLLMSVVTNIFQAAAVMLAAGFARGTCVTGATKTVLEWFPPRSRGTAMGIKQLGLPVAGFLIALTLPTIGLALGWRIAVAIPGGLVLIAGILVAVLYRNAQHPRDGSTDKLSARMAIKELIRNRGMWILSVSSFLFFAVQVSLIAYLVLYLKEIVLVPVIPDEPARIVAAGAFLAICQVGGVLGRVFWGVVSDRVFNGRRGVVLVIIGLISTLLAVAMAGAAHGYPLWLLAALVLVFGATAVAWNGIYNAMLVEMIGRKYAGTGVGLSLTIADSGTVVGPPVFGFVVDVTGSYQPAWLLVGLASLAGTIIAAVAAKGEKRQAERSALGVVTSS